MSDPAQIETVDVVVVGGGNAGISLAAYLRRTAPTLAVVLVAPESQHRYRPLLSYVGGGMCHPRRTLRAQRRVVPPGVRWVQDCVTQVEPAADGGLHTVVTGGGVRLHANDVVLCPGTEIDWDAVPGSRDACRSAHGSTNYDPQLAPHTWRVLRDLERGDAVFLVSDRNTPCPGVGLKPLFLAADHWRREGRLDAIDLTVVLEAERPFGLDRADTVVVAELERLGATIHTGARLASVDPDDRVVSFTTADGARATQRYDALHLAPAHRGYPWLVATGLTDPRTTLVANDPETHEHPAHPGLWALGDAATLGTPSSGGGLRHQVPVVAHNIVARREGRHYRSYDGYTVAPIPLDRHRLLLAERDRDGREVRTVPFFSLARPLRALLWFDLVLQPPVYWYRLLRGRGLDQG